jgi:hypothetical protein
MNPGMANVPNFGREALRRFREQEAAKEQAAKDAAAKRAAEAAAEETAKKSKKRPPQPRLWLKTNVSPGEFTEFQNLARAAELTLSNYIRKRLGLPITHPGRPRKN